MSAAAVTILPHTPERAPHFRAINAAWITEMFTLEKFDEDVLSYPERHIMEPGGDILYAAIDTERGLEIVGAGALRPLGDGVLELTKMGVTDAAQGSGVGTVLLRALIDRAMAIGVRDLVLLTSSKCVAAIHLYEAAGFFHSRAVADAFAATYKRCDVSMRFGGADLTIGTTQ